MRTKTKRVLALLVYLALIFLPLIVFLFFPMPPGRSFWRDLSIMLGFVGLSMAGLQFLPTARLPFLSNVFDLDGIYRVHHLLSVLSVLLILLHPVILLVNNPYTLLLLNPFTAPWRAQAGLIGLAGLILIAITSVLRKELKLDYNAWHGLHDLLAFIIVVFAVIHLLKVNYYMNMPAMRIAWLVEVVIWAGHGGLHAPDQALDHRQPPVHGRADHPRGGRDLDVGAQTRGTRRLGFPRRTGGLAQH